MKIQTALPAVLACLMSTLVATWLVGTLVKVAVDEMDPDSQEILASANAPWFRAGCPEIRRLDSITVVGHREREPATSAETRGAP
jgi:hypothetical protein